MGDNGASSGRSLLAVSWTLVVLSGAALAAGISLGGIALVLVAVGGSIGAAVFLALALLLGRRSDPRAGDDDGDPEVVGTVEAEAAPPIVFLPPDDPAPAPDLLAFPADRIYHHPACRLVAERPDAEELTRATAELRGYASCEVCRPG